MPHTITVVVPTYNRKALLGRLFTSLDRQSLSAEHFTVIVVDDGSTDGTAEVVAAHRAEIIQIPRRGPAAARNAGARKAQTPVIAFIDDDALARPAWLQIIYDAFISGALAGAAEGDVLRQGEEVPLSHFVHHQGPGGYLTCNLALRREVFDKLGGFNEAFPFPMNEDFEFFLRLRKTVPLIYLPGMTVDHPVRLLPFWRTWAASFAHARQRITSEHLLYKLAPSDYGAVKAVPTAAATVRRLALGYFFLHGLNRPGLLLKHPWRGLLWLKVCATRQLAFFLYFISGRRSWNASL